MSGLSNSCSDENEIGNTNPNPSDAITTINNQNVNCHEGEGTYKTSRNKIGCCHLHYELTSYNTDLKVDQFYKVLEPVTLIQLGS